MRQDILQKYPKAKLKVYAIWLKRGPWDTRAGWPSEMFADPRVEQFWDAKQQVGALYGATLPGQSGGIYWDSYVLHGPDATWDKAPSNPLAWHRTIISGMKKLNQQLAILLK